MNDFEVGMDELTGPANLRAYLAEFLGTTLFLAVAAGAVLLVMYELGRMVFAQRDHPPDRRMLVAGFLFGLMVMYATGLLIVT